MHYGRNYCCLVFGHGYSKRKPWKGSSFLLFKKFFLEWRKTSLAHTQVDHEKCWGGLTASRHEVKPRGLSETIHWSYKGRAGQESLFFATSCHTVTCSVARLLAGPLSCIWIEEWRSTRLSRVKGAGDGGRNGLISIPPDNSLLGMQRRE